jgi:hypothetical protein
MRNKIHSLLQLMELQYSPRPLMGLPLLHPAELTRLSWANKIRSYHDVPDAYQDFFGPLFATGREFPYTVLTPSFERFINPTTEKLVCDFGTEIYVLEKIGDSFESHCYPLDAISHVEVRSMLLYYHLRICAVIGQEFPASVTIKCNSVTAHLLTPILERIRLGNFKSNGTISPTELEKFDYLAEPYYKFMSYARHSLLAGEIIIQSIFQPEIRANIFAKLGKSYWQASSPAHLLILTDRECIWIRDDECREEEAKHGCIWDYIPLNKIEKVSLHRKNERLLSLTIQLPANERLEMIFPISAQEKLEQVQDNLRHLTPKIS